MIFPGLGDAGDRLFSTPDHVGLEAADLAPSEKKRRESIDHDAEPTPAAAASSGSGGGAKGKGGGGKKPRVAAKVAE